MSSEISTDAAAAMAAPDAPPAPRGPKAGQPGGRPASTFAPWQLYTLAGLISAAFVAFQASAQPPVARVFLILTVFAAAVIGLTMLRTLAPLTGALPAERNRSLGERTRAALERDKLLALRSIKELEFDRAMKKVSEKDYEEISARLRARAARILRDLDAGEGLSYRETIERDLARRLGAPSAPPVPAPPASAVAPRPPAACVSCGTANDADARFCKGCGGRLEAA
jgi:hypothetical protein